MTILSTVTPTTAYLGDTVTLTAEVSETISSSHITMWILDFDEATDSSTTIWQFMNQDRVINYEWSPFSSETDMSSEIQVDENMLEAHTLTFILAQGGSMGISISNHPELFTIGNPINISFKLHLYDKVKKLGNQWFYLKDEISTLLSAKVDKSNGASQMTDSSAYANLGTNSNATQKTINNAINGEIGSLNTSISNKLAKGDWTTLSDTESYVTTKADMITTSAWNLQNITQGGGVNQTTLTLTPNSQTTYTNNTSKKVQIQLTWVSGEIDTEGGTTLFQSGDQTTIILKPNESIGISSLEGGICDYTAGTQSNIISSIIDVAYPVGSIYISSSTMHPSVIFGGVWEHFAEDKFLLSAGSTYEYNTTGGSADAVVVKHNHTQNSHNHTQNSHNHNSASNGAYVITVDNDDWTYTSKRKMSYTSGNYYYPYSPTNNGGVGQYNKTGGTTATNQSATATNQESGEDGTGKNMPPYLAVFVWKRIG